MSVENQKQGCKCRNLTIIFLNNGDPFIAKHGAQDVSEIKDILGIQPHETLFQVVDGVCPIEYKDDSKVVIKGCETFYGAPPAGGNSREPIEKELMENPFEFTFGVNPKLVREAGEYLLVLEQVSVGLNKKVDIALEWPKKNRLLFSERIETPKCKNPNWAEAYRDLMFGGKKWQGVSLQTQETKPFRVLLSYLRALI